MTIPIETTKVNLNGHLGTHEVFSVGFWLSGNAASTLTDCQTQANAIAGYFPGYLASAYQGLLDSNSGWDQVSVYSYPTGGPNATVSATAPIAAGVGTGTGSLPLQSALVITTQTPYIGRSARGRMYLPAVGLTLNVDHEIGLTQLTAVVDATAAFLNHISTSSVLGDPAVVSQKGPGGYHLITALRADSRLDIQRRRAEQQTPTSTYSAGV